MSLVLHPHQVVKRPHWKVSGSMTREGRQLTWKMRVDGEGQHTNSHFGPDPRKNWELWNWDVVETFIQLRSHPDDLRAPYLELQLSPLNQGLALGIIEPRRKFYTPLKLDFQSTTTVGPTAWESMVKVVLPEEFPDGELWGGLFACLGSGEREFYSLNPNPEARPDFHRPELFQKL